MVKNYYFYFDMLPNQKQLKESELKNIPLPYTSKGIGNQNCLKNEIKYLGYENNFHSQEINKQKNSAETQEKLVKEKDDIILEQSEKIKKQNDDIEKKLKEIKEKDDIILEQSEKIKKQNNEIEKKSKEIQIQKDNSNYYRNEKNKEIEKNDELKDINQHFQNLINNLENNIRKSQKQIDDKQKQMDGMKKILEQFSSKDKENNKKLRELNNLSMESRKEIRRLERLLREEKDENKKQELIRQKNIEKIKNLFNKNFEMFKSEKIRIITEDVKITYKNFCKDDICKLCNKKAKGLVTFMFNKNQILEPINLYLKTLMKEAKNKISSVEHLNILLVGPAGSGKTTLINVLLKLNLPTGFGCAITQKTESHSSEEIPFLRLVDSKGIEKAHGAGVDAVFREISQYIKNQKDPDKLVHCIWYCWTGTRLEGVELELLKKLSQQYSLKKLPVIIVYTQALEPDKIEKEKEYFKKLNIDNDFVEILALNSRSGHGDKIFEIESFGLDKLTELSIERAKDAVDSSCYEVLLKKIKEQAQSELIKIVNDLKQKINVKIEKLISEIDKNLNITYLRTKLIEIIVEIFNNFFYLTSEIKINEKENYKATIKTCVGDLYSSISDETLNGIKDFILNYFEDFINLFDKNYEQLVNDYTNKLSKEVIDFRKDFIIAEKISDITDSNELIQDLRSNIKCRIYNSVKKIAFKNLFLNAITPIVEQSKILFESLCKEAILKDNLKDEGKKMVRISFDKIEEKIKRYNNKLKNDKIKK